jgi:hypothetical protein
LIEKDPWNLPKRSLKKIEKIPGEFAKDPWGNFPVGVFYEVS